LSTRGRRGELNANSEEVSENLEVCIHMFRGGFLAVFSVEFVLCSTCDLSLPFFGFGHELRFFVFLSSFFL
jgi:hypothetical protein